MDPIRPPIGLHHAFRADVLAARLPTGRGDARPITEDDLARLPPVVRRYLTFMGVVGRPRVWSFRVRFAGRFRLSPTAPWMPAEAWQYNSGVDVARIFTMRLRAAHVVPMIGHDTYVRGRGRMIGKILGLVTVADGEGEEFDIGELSTWLNDAVLLAPSMLLRPDVGWEAVDGDTFDVTLRDAGRQVRAQVRTDDRGAPVDYWTTDRFAALEEGPVRARWRTPIARWDDLEGRPFPAPGEATWDLPDGPFTYVEGGFVPGTFTANLAPDDV